MRKGLLCVILTLILLFSAQPAAAAETGNHRSTTITADCRLPNIHVTVPTSGTVYLNPLKLPVSIGDIEVDDEQIISTPACIANMSDAPLQVDVTVTGAVKTDSTMSLAVSPTKGKGTSKSAFVYFEIQASDSEDPDDVEWASAYDKSKHVAVIEGVPITKKDIVRLSAKTLDDEVADGGYAPFRLSGDAVETPDEAWTKKDGIIVTVAFTFTPLPYSQ